MQATLVMQLEAVPIVKASLALKRKALAFSLRQYEARLTAFEQQHQFTSEQFARAFAAGELGDAEVWFEWEFVLEAVKKLNFMEMFFDA